jgi:MoxR-vWA-beta-propeller ternary system domain bpX4
MNDCGHRWRKARRVPEGITCDLLRERGFKGRKLFNGCREPAAERRGRRAAALSWKGSAAWPGKIPWDDPGPPEQSARMNMDPLDEFLERLFSEGRVVFDGRPEPLAGPLDRPVARLRAVFEIRRLEVAGPVIPFDPRVALDAAEVVRQACWALVSRGMRAEEMLMRVRMPVLPTTASHHLSADIVFRLLPGVHRRSRGIDPSDRLTTALADLLRSWPLSGVLADLDEGPASPPDLARHPGLLLLYAERLARHNRETWRPSPEGMEYVELVANGGVHG